MLFLMRSPLYPASNVEMARITSMRGVVTLNEHTGARPIKVPWLRSRLQQIDPKQPPISPPRGSRDSAIPPQSWWFARDIAFHEVSSINAIHFAEVVSPIQCPDMSLGVSRAMYPDLDIIGTKQTGNGSCNLAME